MKKSSFEVIERRGIRSLNIEFEAYRHAATGARHFHLASDDTNNAFMVAFPTLPQDSTGVAHILEHTSLCGSTKYPVRDPFFMMSRRSLNTFMNAFTSSDSTAYPFATQNRKDFDNLLSVYLDAVFFPRLDPLDFAQEGYRIEFAEADNPNSELLYKGVVYNEMKGAMSSPVTQLWHHLQAQLFPTTVYRFNSGGDPAVIPDLTYEDLKSFHGRYYHPSHSVLMTYGSFPAREHQQHFQDWVLAKFSQDPGPIISALEPPLHEPVAVRVAYGTDSAEHLERNTHIVWGWSLGESADPETLLTAHLISGVLLEHSASPLRHYLETTEHANAPSDLCGVDDSARQLVFCCGVEGTDPEHADALEGGILALLERTAVEGIDTDTLAAIIDRMEMAQRDIGGGNYPYGLQLMGRALPGAMYGTDPAVLLDIDPILDQLQKCIADPNYIKRLIRRRLLDNPHRARVTMVPDTSKLDEDSDAERRRLASLHAELTRDRIARLQLEASALKARQAQADDPDLLPKVTLADVPPGIVKTAGRVDRLDNTAVHCYERGTNGLSYLHLVIDLPGFSDEELSHLPLFCEYVTEFGMGDQSYLEVQTGRARVGVFGAYATLRADLEDTANMRGHFVITAKGLERKNDLIVDALLEMLPRVRFDECGRLRELLAQSRSETELSITERGHHLAIIGAARGLSAGAWLDDVWEGPASIRLLKSREDRARGSASAVAGIQSVFSTIRDKLLASPYRLLTVAEQRSVAGIQAAIMRSRHEIHGTGGGQGFLAGAPGPGGHAAWTTNTQVNFCAKAYPVVPEGHPDAATLMVLGRYVQDGFLHPAIREVGGAYGSGASYDADSSTFRLFSYRDPRLEETLLDFDRSLEWLRETRDPRRLEEAILGVIRSLDQPRSPAGEAIRAFYNELQGRSDAFRQLFRERVLNTGLDDLMTVADRHLALNSGTVGVVTSTMHGPELERLGIELMEL